MDIQLNDVLHMKKPHPCGEKRWLVLRTGADFRLRCLGGKKYPHRRAENGNVKSYPFVQLSVCR